MLVNRDFRLKEIDYEKIDLVKLDKEDVTDSRFTYRLNKETYIAFLKLKKFLKENIGIDILVDGGFRDLYRQKQIYDEILLENFKKNKEIYNIYDAYHLAKVQTYERVAPVGASEHHTGYAIDLGILFDGRVLKLSNPNDYYYRIYIYDIVKNFLSDFGFILRYPEDTESEKITGYNFEPWHIRYVGKKVSKDMEEKHIITLEEYLRPDIYKRGKTIRRH